MKKIYAVILGSREFKGRTGATFAALSLLNVLSGKFSQTTATGEQLVAAGIEGPSATDIVEIQMEDDEMRTRIVGFRKTAGKYTMRIMDEAELPSA